MEDTCLALVHTVYRRLTEASPHVKLWGIGLSACGYPASSPDTWHGYNLLDRALEILYSKTMPQIPDSITPAPTTPVDHSSDTIFEVDPVTLIRLDTGPSTRHTHSAISSAFPDSMPDVFALEILMAHTRHADEPLKPKQGASLAGGIVTMDDVTFTTLLSLKSGISATSRVHCRVLLDTESP